MLICIAHIVSCNGLCCLACNPFPGKPCNRLDGSGSKLAPRSKRETGRAETRAARNEGQLREGIQGTT